MSSKDPFNEFADGFLSGPELSVGGETLRPIRSGATVDRDRRSPPIRPASDGGAPVLEPVPPLGLEVLFPGNLPVWANLWLPAYVQRIARGRGPVALIRLQYKSCSIQVFGEGSEPIDPPEDACQRISDLARWVAGNLAQVVVVPRTIDDDEAILEADLPITIMTGADEAAKIEAYRRSKELVEAARGAELPLPALSLVIAGTNENDARAIASRISETASRFLKFDLPLELVIPSMGPESVDAPTVTPGRHWDVPVGPTYDTERLVAELRRAALDRGSAGAGPIAEIPASPVDPAPSTVPGPEVILASLEPEPVPASDEEVLDPPSAEELTGLIGTGHVPLVAADAPVMFEESFDGPYSTPFDEEAERSALRAKFEAAPVPEVTPVVEPEPPVEAPLVLEEGAPDVADPDRGTRHAGLVPGLEPVDLPCPVSPGIGLALDDQRRLHLVADEASLRDLRAAEAWAVRNRSLLAAVFADGLAPFEDHGLRLDLVVRDAAAASDLHGTGLLLHLLVEAPGSGPSTIPLNNERTAFVTR